MKISIEKKIVLAFALVLAVLVTISVVTYRNTTRMIENHRLVSHTQDVMVALDDTLSAMVDAETGQRGYILTGKELFLEPYQSAISEIGSDIERLQRLTADNPHQQQRLALLKPLISEKLKHTGETIALRRESGFEAAQRVVLTGYGKQRMDEIRRIVAGMEAEERQLLKLREAESEASARSTMATLFILALIVLALLPAGFYIIKSDFRKRKLAEDSLQKEREFLATVLENISDGIIACDAKGTLTLLNRAAREFLGLPEKSNPSDRWAHFDLYLADGKTSMEKEQVPLFRALREGSARDVELVIVPKHAVTRRLIVSGQAVFDAQGITSGAVIVMHDITERKHVEDALRESQARFAAFMNNSPAVAFMKDEDGRFVYINQSFERLFNMNGREIIGKTDAELWPEDIARQVTDNDRLVLTTNKPSELVETVPTPDGSAQHWLTYKFPVKETSGRTFLGGVAIDITERKRAEEELRGSEQRFQLATRATNDVMWDWDLATNGVWWNEGIHTVFGYPVHEVGDDLDWWLKNIHPDDEEPIGSSIHQFLDGDEQVWTGEYRYARADGSYATVIDRGIVVRDEQGKPLRMIGSMLDITERKRTQEALQQSEERFRSVAQSANDAIIAADGEGNVLSWNNGAHKIFGYTEEEALGQPLTILMPEKYRAMHTAGIARHAATGEAHVVGKTIELTGLRKDGSEFPIELSLSAWKTGQENFYSSIIRDITERKQAEQALALESSLMQALMDNIPDAIYFKDTQSRFLRVSKHVHLQGIKSPEEAIGKTDFDFFPEESARAFYEDEQQIVRTGEPIIDKEQKEIFPDGTTCWVLSTKVPIFGAEGEVTGIVGASRDITERKRIAQEIEHARDAALESTRLKSEFLANMSHEIRTPMNGVVGMTSLLLDTKLNEEQQDYAETIRASADSLLTVINDILDFSKIEAGKLQFEKLDFDLRNAVEGSIELLAERAHAKGIELASLVEGDVPTGLHGDPGRLRQVLTNLLGNAVKFTEQGEVLLRVTKESETDSHVITRFAVSDTGIGISETERRNLFQAFVQADGSTTRKYGGTGLGLAIAKQLVEMMNGEIGIESEVGKGSTFWFTARFEKHPDGGIVRLPVKAHLEGVRVLIVDDNATNRRILMHQIASWGMVGDEVDSGAMALESLRRAACDGAAYDLAIMDLMMPAMDGFELARAIKQDASIAATRLVLLTSFGQRGHGATAREAGIAAYLTKPVRQSQLFDCLATITGEPDTTIGESALPAKVVTRHTIKEAGNHFHKRVLVAEDNAVNQKVALRQLEKLGYSADIVANGREAIAALAAITYNIVLMDCQMPEMDGYEATAAIRRREGFSKHTIIIAMTANAMQGDREKCLAAGMDDYIGKPVKSDELQQALERWTTQTAQATEHTSNVPADGTAEKSMDMSVLEGFRELQMDGAPDLVAELIEMFLRDTTSRLSDMRKAVFEENARAAMQHAHSLKGSSSNLGAYRMAALAGELEQFIQDESVRGADAVLNRMEEEFARVRETLERQTEKVS